MIFKFDRAGNMENIGTEGDFDMGRKGNKDKFQQVDVSLINQVKEEVMSGMTTIAAGFESLDEIVGDEDMVQQHETELVKEMDVEVDDEKLKQQMRELNMRNMPSLSNLTKMKDENEGKEDNEDSSGEGVGSDKEQMVKNELNETRNELEAKRIEKEEKEKKKLARDLKKELKQRLDKLNNSSEWKFENTVEISRNKETCKYQTIASAEFLGNLLDRKIAIYVGDLQRGWRKNNKNDLVEVKSEKQIKLILDSLLHNRMHGGFITLNLNPNDGYDINFNEEDGTISGSINQKLQILDGNHRLNSFSRWAKLYKRNPESVPNPADYYISVVIETLNDDDAKSLFSEYATKSLKISKSRGEFLNVEDYTNKLCRDIMKKSDIKVEVVSTSIKANSENIITFGVFSKNIKDNYNPKSKIEVEELSNYLSLFIDSLISTFPKYMASKDLTERAELRTHNLAMEALSWGGYLKLSTRLQGKSREEILSILNKFNSKVDYKGWRGSFLDKENPIFRKIMREGFKIINTSSSTTWINKVFIEYVLEGKSLEEIGKEEVK